MRNYFTFDGIDSRTFGVYISGQGTFKAPARSYDAFEIPGRNGSLLGIESRLNNVELTYPAFIYQNFAENIAAFRAFLLSHKGYFKLKDSYHPDEFRIAYYQGPFEPDVTNANNAGSFNITFICKPQRYLDSGEQVVELNSGAGTTRTVTGNPASFTKENNEIISSLSVPINPIQNLNGYSRPWAGGAGKNKIGFMNTRNSYGIYFTYNSDGSTTINGTCNGGTSFQQLQLATYYTNYTLYPAGSYKVTGATGVSEYYLSVVVVSSTGTVVDEYYPITENQIITLTSPSYICPRYVVTNHTQLNNVKMWPMIRDASIEDDTWEPYANICPINGSTGLSAYVSPTQNVADATTYVEDWTSQAGTVYGGTINIKTGELTVDRVFTSTTWSAGSNATVYGECTRKRFSFSDADDKSKKELATCNVASYIINDTSAEWAKGSFFSIHNSNKLFYLSLPTSTDGATEIQLCYYLATPITYTLTAQAVEILSGQNYIWSSNNQDITVILFSLIPQIINNPTMFDSLPLLRVYGVGILGIGSHTVTITDADDYTDIDCEMMDCFKGSANKNQYVQFSGNDFPTLEPGVNGFTFLGITKVEVKPRWWSV